MHKLTKKRRKYRSLLNTKAEIELLRAEERYLLNAMKEFKQRQAERLVESFCVASIKTLKRAIREINDEIDTEGSNPAQVSLVEEISTLIINHLNYYPEENKLKKNESKPEDKNVEEISTKLEDTLNISEEKENQNKEIDGGN